MIKTLVLLVTVLSFSQSALAAYLIGANEALRKIYKEATRFEESYFRLNDDQLRQIEDEADIRFAESHAREVIIYSVYENDLLVGRAFEDTVIGKWGPIHYLAGLDTAGVIVAVIILDYEEIRGKPIAKRRFLKQYKGKSVQDPLKLRSDIDGVTGATISSRSLTDGIRKIVHIFQITGND